MANKKLKHLLKYGLPALIVVSLLVGLGVTPAMAEAGTLDHVAVSPANATLLVGATQQFTAQGYDAANNVIPGLNFLWNVAAGGGSIGTAGLFTAGNTTGSFPNTIQAFAVQGSVIKLGTASIIVTSSTGQPPPLPHAFYGNLTVEGSPASPGAVVVARVGGVERGRIITTVIGKYGSAGPLEPKLIVQGNITDGSIVSFYVNDIPANQSYAFKAGENTELNLTAVAPEPSPGGKLRVNKLLALVRSSIRALGFSNLLNAQWSVKVGDKTMELKAIAGVIQAISNTSLSILPTGQPNPATFTLTRDTVIRGEDGLKIGKQVAVVTVDGATSLVAHLPVAKGEKGLFPGLTKGDDNENGKGESPFDNARGNDKGKGNKGKAKPPFGNAWGHGKDKD